jgi:hypothetical protein
VTAPIVQRLRDAAASLPAGRVSMRALAQAHGSEAQGTLLVLMAVPCMLPLPGVGTALGLGMVALAAVMWRGDPAAESLPRRVAELELSHACAQRVLGLLATTYALAGRCAKARLSEVASVRGRSWTAATIGVMAVLIVLPIPLGNLLPALSTMLIGLGRVFRDGVAVICGLAMAGLALVFTGGLLRATWVWGSEWITRWMAM